MNASADPAATDARRFPLRILTRPLLVPAMLAEDQAGSLAILLDSESSPDQRNIGLWHETLHLLLRAAGYLDHDEARIEQTAQALAACCPDLAALAEPPS